MTVELIEADKTYSCLMAHLVALHDSVGRADAADALRNITEHKKAIEALQARALEFQLLFESSHDAMMTMQLPSWEFTRANLAAVKLFGAPCTAEFLAHMPWEYSPERQPDGRLSSDKAQEINARILCKGYHRFEWEHQRLDGQRFTADVLVNCMEVGGGGGTAFAGNCTRHNPAQADGGRTSYCRCCFRVTGRHVGHRCK